MPASQRGYRIISRRWLGLVICVLAPGIGLVAWLLISEQPLDTAGKAIASDLESRRPIEADASRDDSPLVTAAAEPAIEDSIAQNSGSSPPEPSRTRPKITDLHGRERLELAGRRNRGPGAAEVAARNAELQPPEAELLSKTSPELVDELASSPLQISIYHSSDNRLDGLLASFARAHMGVDILLSRPDAAASLLENYRAYSETIVDPDTPGDVRGNPFEFATLEVLLGANVVLDQFESQNQLPTLIESVLLSLEHKAQYDSTQPEPVFGEATLDQTATVVGRALVRLDDPNFLLWLDAPEREGIFSDRPPTYEETHEILDMAATAYGPENAEVSLGDPRE